jgi:DNA polymerase III subunit delta'
MSEPDPDLPSPRENPELHGHAEAEAALLDAFNDGRLAHAWLICGPRGVGKATLAFRFARFVLAQGDGGASGGGLFGDALPAAKPETLHMDPDHPVFRRTSARGHADLLTIERGINEKTGKPRTEIIVDDVRGIGSFLCLTPAEGGWRVVVIDSADDMNRHAANAVLKVLEEPSPRALLLLVSHNPGRLLPTIRSRCRRLTLKPLKEDRLAAHLRELRPDLDGTDALELARLAEGSVGRAISLATEGGLDLYRDLLELLDTLPSLDVPAVHALSERLAKVGAEETYRAMTDMFRGWLGRLIVYGAAPGQGDSIALTAAEKAIMERLSRAGTLDRWMEVWEKINRLLGRADGANLDRRQVVLNAFLAVETAARS